MKSVWKAHLAAFLANVIYGANYSIAKEVMPRFFQPFGLIVFRVSGAILLFALLFWGKTERIQKKDIPRFALCGLLGVVIDETMPYKSSPITTTLTPSGISVLNRRANQINLFTLDIFIYSSVVLAEAIL